MFRAYNNQDRTDHAMSAGMASSGAKLIEWGYAFEQRRNVWGAGFGALDPGTVGEVAWLLQKTSTVFFSRGAGT